MSSALIEPALAVAPELVAAKKQKIVALRLPLRFVETLKKKDDHGPIPAFGNTNTNGVIKKKLSKTEKKDDHGPVPANGNTNPNGVTKKTSKSKTKKVIYNYIVKGWDAAALEARKRREMEAASHAMSKEAEAELKVAAKAAADHAAKMFGINTRDELKAAAKVAAAHTTKMFGITTDNQNPSTNEQTKLPTKRPRIILHVKPRSFYEQQAIETADEAETEEETEEESEEESEAETNEQTELPTKFPRIILHVKPRSYYEQQAIERDEEETEAETEATSEHGPLKTVPEPVAATV